LHDGVGQTMSAVILELGEAEDALAANRERASERLGRARRLAEESVNSVRSIALLLRPSMLDDLGLTAAVQWQAREVSRRTGIRIQVESSGMSDDLPDEHRTCIYRVLQEALHNAARHSGATQIVVEIRAQNDSVEITVRDNGKGFDPLQMKGIGILGMEERVHNLGGVFSIDGAPGRGACISAMLPLNADSAAGTRS
jgi:signal transduction histidine kinase